MTNNQSLDEWVRWLVRTYLVDAVVPQCWHEHRGLLEELRSLQEAYEHAESEAAAAQLGDATSDEMLRWHEGLDRTVQRLASRPWGAGCANERNHVPSPTTWVGDPPAKGADS
jgi:hypothetical protein